MELYTYMMGGYATCQVEMVGKRMRYLSHDAGAKHRWLSVIRQINAGEQCPSYVSSGGDCFGVVIKD